MFKATSICKSRIAADDLATQGGRTSAAMLSTQFSWNILVSPANQLSYSGHKQNKYAITLFISNITKIDIVVDLLWSIFWWNVDSSILF